MARMPTRLAVVLVAVVVSAGLASCHGGPPNTYVALGDSYVAGPLIPNQIEPRGCLKSDHNYPHLAFNGLGLTRLTDVSCSGAKTEDMFNPQDVDPDGPNPPQLNAVGDHTAVLTLGIGGNDIGFTDIAVNCGNPLDLTPCRDDYVQNGNDELRNRIDATGPLVDNVLDAINGKAPQADVFVVGYPTILPDEGDCYPREPIKPVDVEYLRGIVKYLNAMLEKQAADNGAEFIDLYTPSIGHDICQIKTVKWVEGVTVTSPAAPVHPNGLGMENFANIVRPQLQAALR